MNKILDNQITFYVVLTITALVMITIFGSMAWFGYLETLDLKKELVKKQQESKERATILTKLQDAQNNLAEIERRDKESSEKLPEDAQYDVLLKDLAKIAKDSNLSSIVFQKKPEKFDEIQGLNYTTLPVEATISSSYTELSNFLENIYKNKRLINITGMKINSTATEEKKLTLTTTLNFNVFFLQSGSSQ